MTEAAKPLHSKLGASTAERWMNCPGANDMIASLDVIPPPSKYAIEGTAMHSAGEQRLRGIEVDWETIKDGDGEPVEQDCVDAVEVYTDTVTADHKTYGGKLFVEHKFTVPLRDDMWGTNDALLAYCTDRVLRVYDFKGGAGLAVEVTGNKQLMYYGLGAMLNLPKLHATEVELVIVQPRARHPQGPVRRWRISILDLYDFSVALLAAAKATEQPGAPLVGGPWCRNSFCPAVGQCRAHIAYAERQMQIQFSKPDVKLPNPNTMTAEELGAFMQRAPVWEEVIAGVRAAAHAAAVRGIVIPGCKIVAKRGKREWTGEDHETVTALQALGLKQRELFTSKIKSPAQIEKMLPKELRERLATLCQMVSSGTSFVLESDPRPAVPAPGAMGFEASLQGVAASTASLPDALR